MHRPVELDAAEAADVPWRMAEDFQEPEGDRPATSAQAVDISSSHDLDELAAVKSEPKAAASSDLAEIFDR
ncbi:MAG: hypothetical protein HC838_04585 [Spirulinaceae cyanobacterium RM2_2_10]|nr:hypothetical protein [Spirulinaceae cyanobacterium RM2_2_10]